MAALSLISLFMVRSVNQRHQHPVVFGLCSHFSQRCAFLLPYDLGFCAEKVIPKRHVSCLQKGVCVNNSQSVST